MADFKKGAFSVAAKEKALVVPITLVGTSARMKNGKEWMLRSGGIKVVVHPPIQSKGGDAQARARRPCVTSFIRSNYVALA